MLALLCAFVLGTASAQTPTPTVYSGPVISQAPKVDSPTTVIKNYTEELKKVVEIKDPTKKGVEDKAREATIAEKVKEFFDFQELARQSLGTNWSKQTLANRQKFSKLFTTIVEESYLKRSRSLVSDYEVTFVNESIEKNKANVTSRIAQKDASVDITYDLHKKKGKWMIYNITLDNVNLVRNYQSQFNQIIKKKGFNGLIKSMEDRTKSSEIDV